MSNYIKYEEIPLELMGPGIQRKILGYQENLMLVKVFLEKGSVADLHHHPHQQIGHVLEGKFEMEIDEGVERVRKKLERSWNKLNPDMKKIIKDKYEAAIKILVSLDKNNQQ